MESAKRRPPMVDPVVVDGVRYEVNLVPRAAGISQNSGVITAVEEASERELWHAVVYKVPEAPDDGEEEDSVDIFITALELSEDGESIIVTNERGDGYAVRINDQSVSVFE